MKKFKNIYIEITKACNLKCPFCPSKNVSTNDYISFDNFKYIIDEIKDYTKGVYLHILGEPLLHQELFNFIEYASKYVKVSITTNGRLINKYLDKLINANIYVLNISMQSLINETDEYIDNYLNIVDTFIKQKKDQLAVHLRIWNDKEKNEHLNKKLYSFLNALDVSKYPNVNVSTALEFDWPTLDCEDNEKRSSCLGGKTQLGILVNGDVTICCLDYLGHTKLDNIYKTKFKEILNSNVYQKVVSGWQNKESYFELCKKCTFRNRFIEGGRI